MNDFKLIEQILNQRTEGKQSIKNKRKTAG